MYRTTDRSAVGEVYPDGVADVNPTGAAAQRRLLYGVAVLLSALAAGGLACAPNRAGMMVQADQAFYPVGVCYGVESVPSTDRNRLDRRIDADLATIRRMGLNTVFFRHIDPKDFATVAAAARRHQLKIVLPDRPAQNHVMTGVPESHRGPPSWLRNEASPVTRALWAVDLGRAVDPASAERLERVAASYRLIPSPLPTFARTVGPVPESVAFPASASGHGESPPAPADDRPSGRPMMILRCHHEPGESPADAVRRWLWEFHAALAWGLTGGLVIDQYCTIPGRGSALAGPDGNVGVERINAVKRMADRMWRWGPMLDRLDLKSYAAPASAGAGDTLVITVFARDRRRLLLVFNPSRSEYLRTTLTLDEVVAGVPATRLVEVPGDSKLSLGAVHEARRGRITLPVNIAPGDARLFEVF